MPDIEGGDKMIQGLYEAHLPVSDLDRSIEFYENLGLELAHRSENLAFFWIQKGKSWLGLWQCEQVHTPYHVSLRHIAFYVEDIKKAKEWLQSIGVEVSPFFGFSPDRQPLVLSNVPHAHAAIYFKDPDGNLLELISPLQIDTADEFPNMELEKWQKINKGESSR
jgi:catechol 2,3-dioxygenase-like lactoylglutathione lyase family enzyme